MSDNYENTFFNPFDDDSEQIKDSQVGTDTEGGTFVVSEGFSRASDDSITISATESLNKIQIVGEDGIKISLSSISGTTAKYTISAPSFSLGQSQLASGLTVSTGTTGRLAYYVSSTSIGETAQNLTYAPGTGTLSYSTATLSNLLNIQSSDANKGIRFNFSSGDPSKIYGDSGNLSLSSQGSNITLAATAADGISFDDSYVISQYGIIIENPSSWHTTNSRNVALKIAAPNNSVPIHVGTSDFIIDKTTSANVGIGTATPSYKLHVVGDVSGSDAHFDNTFVNHLTSSDDVTIGGDGNFARIRLRRSDDAVVGEIFQNAGTTDIINNQGSGIRLMYQGTPLMHAKTTGVSLGYSQTNLHQVTGSMHISGATTGHLTASGHVSASIFYGDGSSLTGINFDPAGNNTEIQFNDSGIFGASPDFTWNDSSKQLTVNGQFTLQNNSPILKIKNNQTSTFGMELDYGGVKIYSVKSYLPSGEVRHDTAGNSYYQTFYADGNKVLTLRGASGGSAEITGSMTISGSSHSIRGDLTLIDPAIAGRSRLYFQSNGSVTPYIGTVASQIEMNAGSYGITLKNNTTNTMRILSNRVGIAISGAEPQKALEVGGEVRFGASTANIHQITGSVLINAPDNTSTAFSLTADGQEFIKVDTTDSDEDLVLRGYRSSLNYYSIGQSGNNAYINTFMGSGGTINTQLQNGAAHWRVRSYAADTDNMLYVNYGGAVQGVIRSKIPAGSNHRFEVLNPSGNNILRISGSGEIQITGSTYFSIPDNNTNAFSVTGDGHDYINIDTTNGNEKIILQPNSGSIYPMLTLDNNYLQLYHSGYNHIYMFNNTMRIQGAPIQNQLYFTNAYWQINGHNNATLEITRIDQDANFYHRLTPASSSIFSIEQWGSPHTKVGNYIAVSASNDTIQLSGSSVQITGSTYFSIPDNNANAFSIAGDGHEYIKIDTTDNSETIILKPNSGSSYPILTMDQGYTQLIQTVGNYLYLNGTNFRIYGSPITNHLYLNNSYWQVTGHQNGTLETTRIDQDANFYHRLTPASSSIFSIEEYDTAYNKVGNYLNIASSTDNISLSGSSIQMTGSTYFDDEVYIKTGASETPLTLQIGSSTNSTLKFQGNGSNTLSYLAGSGGGWYHSFKTNTIERFLIGDNYSAFRNSVQVTGSLNVSANITASGTISASAFYGDGSALTNLPPGGISNVVEDTSPQLGGTLDVNGQAISGSVISAISDTFELTGSKFLFDSTHTNDIGLVYTPSTLTMRHGASSIQVRSSNIVSIGGGLLQSPSGLWVNGSGSPHYTINGKGWSYRADNTNGYYMHLGSSGSPKFTVTGSSVGVNTDAPTANLDVVGTFRASGSSFQVTSSLDLSGSSHAIDGLITANNDLATGYSFNLPAVGTSANAFKVAISNSNLVEARYHKVSLSTYESGDNSSIQMNFGGDSFIKSTVASNKGILAKIVGSWSAWGTAGSSVANADGNAFRVVGFSPDTSSDFNYDYFKVSAALSGTIESNLSGSGHFSVNNKDGNKTYLSISGSSDTIRLSGSAVQVSGSTVVLTASSVSSDAISLRGNTEVHEDTRIRKDLTVGFVGNGNAIINLARGSNGATVGKIEQSDSITYFDNLQGSGTKFRVQGTSLFEMMHIKSTGVDIGRIGTDISTVNGALHLDSSATSKLGNSGDIVNGSRVYLPRGNAYLDIGVPSHSVRCVGESVQANLRNDYGQDAYFHVKGQSDTNPAFKVNSFAYASVPPTIEVSASVTQITGDLEVTGASHITGSSYGSDDLSIKSESPGIALIDKVGTTKNNFKISNDSGVMQVSIDTDDDLAKSFGGPHYDDITSAFAIRAGTNGYGKININANAVDTALYVKDITGSAGDTEASYTAWILNAAGNDNAGGLKITAGPSSTPSKDVPILGAYNSAGTAIGALMYDNSGGAFTLYSVSDESLKENIQLSEVDCIEKIRNINLYSYDWKAGGHTDIGFIAQDLEKEVPSAVTDEEVKKISEQKLIPILTKAIQQQQEMIEQLLNRVEELENK